MRISLIGILVWVMGLLLPSCRPATPAEYQPGREQIIEVINQMNELMMHDVTNPPLASRFFAYAMLAGYETLSQSDSTLQPLAKVLTGYPVVRTPAITGYNPQLAALFAMLEIAGRMQPSGKKLVDRQTDLLEHYRRQGMPDDTLTASQAYGHEIAKALVAYAKKDGYNRLSDYPRYTPTKGDGYWYPTPPSFLAAIEPHFNKIRPFILDSAAAFKPVVPAVYSRATNSNFYRQLTDVCRTGQSLTVEQKAIASFWDCNPFAVQDVGHLQIGLKKMSPGAHWMKIAGTVCRQRKISFAKTLQVHTLLAITLMDAFICCWDEKYRSNRIRPETAIRRAIDPNWKPLLQTPPFPEYLSGHSVISGASAEVLTYFFGDNLAYVDSTEIGFGLPPRRFTSFRQAAEEAGISRFYGGIHFMDSVQEGLKQGRKVGSYVVSEFSGPLRSQTSANTLTHTITL